MKITNATILITILFLSLACTQNELALIDIAKREAKAQCTSESIFHNTDIEVCEIGVDLAAQMLISGSRNKVAILNKCNYGWEDWTTNQNALRRVISDCRKGVNYLDEIIQRRKKYLGVLSSLDSFNESPRNGQIALDINDSNISSGHHKNHYEVNSNNSSSCIEV